MNEIMVSIICITYNHANYIRKAFDSFLMQKTKFKFEIIVRDDCSTDGAIDVILEYKEKYPEIFVLDIMEENQYSKGNLPRFVHRLAKGKYCAICEGDDFWTNPYKLQKQVDYLESHPECAFTFHAADELSLLDNSTRAGAPYKKSMVCTINDFIDRRTIYETCTIMYRRSLTHNMPNYHENAPVSDLPLILHLFCNGYGYYLNENMAVHLYMVPGSWSETHNNVEKSINNAYKIIEMYKEFDDEYKQQYHQIVEYEVSRRLFSISLLQRDESSARKYLKKCGFKTRSYLIYYLKLNYPSLFSNLLNLKKRLSK